MLAVGVVLGAALFVGFVVLGGFLVWRWGWLVWAHVRAAVWGGAIEYGGGVCPLTPLENTFRARAGLAGDGGGFVEHDVIPMLYPADLTASKQVVLGTLLVLLNLVAYRVLARRLLQEKRPERPTC